MENTAKLCKTCGKLLTLDNFRFVPRAADKHASVCKECASAARKSKIRGGGNPELAKFSARELIAELRVRGYKGTLEITQRLTV